MSADEERRLLNSAMWYSRRVHRGDRPTLTELAAHYAADGTEHAATLLVLMVERGLVHRSALDHI